MNPCKFIWLRRIPLFICTCIIVIITRTFIWLFNRILITFLVIIENEIVFIMPIIGIDNLFFEFNAIVNFVFQNVNVKVHWKLLCFEGCWLRARRERTLRSGGGCLRALRGMWRSWILLWSSRRLSLEAPFWLRSRCLVYLGLGVGGLVQSRHCLSEGKLAHKGHASHQIQAQDQAQTWPQSTLLISISYFQPGAPQP